MNVRKFKQLAAGLGVTALAVVGLQVLGGESADAHTTGFSGVATCQTNGTYSIQWSGHTDQVPEHDLGTVTETAPSHQVITTSLAPNADYSFQTTVSGTATSASASVQLDWRPDGSGLQPSDTFSASASNSVALSGTCFVTVPVPAAPVPNPATCDHAGSVVIPANSDSVKWTAGPGENQVTAHTVYGYVFPDGTHSKVFTEAVQAQLTGDQCATKVAIPVAPVASAATCNADGSVTIPANTGQVKWLVDGAQVNGGAGGDLGPGIYAVTAHTTFGNIFSNGSHSVAFQVTVLARTNDCPVTPVAPVVTQSVCVNGHATAPVVTLATTPGITYTNDQDEVLAFADNGYVLHVTGDWKLVTPTEAYLVLHFTSPGTCAVVAPPKPPVKHTTPAVKHAAKHATPSKTVAKPKKGLAYTGTPAELLVEIGALGLLLGSAFMFAGKRRKA